MLITCCFKCIWVQVIFNTYFHSAVQVITWTNTANYDAATAPVFRHHNYVSFYSNILKHGNIIATIWNEHVANKVPILNRNSKTWFKHFVFVFCLWLWVMPSVHKYICYFHSYYLARCCILMQLVIGMPSVCFFMILHGNNKSITMTSHER